MGFPQRIEYYDNLDELKRSFEKADQRYRSYRLIRNDDRIDTVFERLRQERLVALERYRQAIVEQQIAVVNDWMQDISITWIDRINRSITHGSTRALCLWLWRKL